MSKSTLSKYLTGLPMIFGIILLVLSPLVLFSLINHIGEQTGTQRIDLTMSVEGYPVSFKKIKCRQLIVCSDFLPPPTV